MLSYHTEQVLARARIGCRISETVPPKDAPIIVHFASIYLLLHQRLIFSVDASGYLDMDISASARRQRNPPMSKRPKPFDGSRLARLSHLPLAEKRERPRQTVREEPLSHHAADSSPEEADPDHLQSVEDFLAGVAVR